MRGIWPGPIGVTKARIEHTSTSVRISKTSVSGVAAWARVLNRGLADRAFPRYVTTEVVLASSKLTLELKYLTLVERPQILTLQVLSRPLLRLKLRVPANPPIAVESQVYLVVKVG